MDTVKRPNQEALNQALNIFRDAMRPFMVRYLRRVPRGNAKDAVRRALPSGKVAHFEQRLRETDGDIAASIDINDFPHLVQSYWHDAFSTPLQDDITIRPMLWLITDGRNQAAHPGTSDLEREYVRTQLFHIANLLKHINAPDQTSAVAKIRDRLATRDAQPSLPLPVDQGETNNPPKRTFGNLKPWRDVILPTRDVAEGSFQQAEFMADLQQVFDGRAETTIYGHPFNFFSQTYITPGLNALMVNTLRRIFSGGGGRSGRPNQNRLWRRQDP